MTGSVLWMVYGSSEAEFAARVSQALKSSHGIDVELLTVFQETMRCLGRNGYTCSYYGDLASKHAGCFCGQRDPRALDEANRKLQSVDVNMLIHSDQLLYLFMERGEAEQLTAEAVLLFDQIFSTGDYQACLRYGTGSAIGRAMSCMAERAGLGSYALATGVGFDTCGVAPVGRQEQWTWLAFPATYDRFRGVRATAEDLKYVEEYAERYFEKHRSRPRTKPDVERELRRSPGGKRRLWPMRWLATRNRPASSSRRPSQNRVAGSRYSFDHLVPHWEAYLAERRNRWLNEYSHFDYDSVPTRYVYAPLNFSWDAPHRAWNPMNYLQEYLLQVVAASMPHGYQLVTKEHPYGLGDPSHAVLAKLREHGVRVVAPSCHSLELVRNAACVFCIGDTTGWEGLLYRVPVVVFGARPFYSAFPHLWQVADPNQVHKALREALTAGAGVYLDQEDEWHALARSAIESSHPGNIWGYKGLVWSDKDASDANVANIARMIARDLGAQ